MRDIRNMGVAEVPRRGIPETQQRQTSQGAPSARAHDDSISGTEGTGRPNIGSAGGSEGYPTKSGWGPSLDTFRRAGHIRSTCPPGRNSEIFIERQFRRMDRVCVTSGRWTPPRGKRAHVRDPSRVPVRGSFMCSRRRARRGVAGRGWLHQPDAAAPIEGAAASVTRLRRNVP